MSRAWNRLSGARDARISGLALLVLVTLFTMQARPLAARSELQPMVEGVVLTAEETTLYVPFNQAVAALSLPLMRSADGKRVFLGEIEVAADDRRALPDGTELIRTRGLAEIPGLGVTVSWNSELQAAHLIRGDHQLWIRRGRRTATGGITFAAAAGALYVPLTEVCSALELPAEGLTADARRVLGDGQALVSVQQLPDSILLSWWDPQTGARLRRGGRELWVCRGAKRVSLNLTEQRMRAWEGGRLVLDTRISSGREGKETPQGSFRAGPLKSRMLISHKYGDAEMPWCVQVSGDVCIHGFASVPGYPASHGCVRVPLTGRNPARWFYEWITIGTPIAISNEW